MSEYAGSHHRHDTETWTLGLHDERRPFEELLEMVTAAQTEVLGRMRSTGYTAEAHYEIREAHPQDALVITLSYQAAREDDPEY